MAMYRPPTSIPSQRNTPSTAAMPDREDTDMGMSNEGLDKFMNQPGGSFSVSRSGGTPTVGSGSDTAGTRPGHEVLGETKLHTGTSLRPGKPSNLYMPPD